MGEKEISHFLFFYSIVVFGYLRGNGDRSLFNIFLYYYSFCFTKLLFCGTGLNMVKVGRPARKVPLKAFNARMSVRILKQLKDLSDRTGKTMRHHMEKSLQNYLPEEHNRVDEQALRLLE